MILSSLDQRAGVLGKARAPETRTGMQKFAADPIVETDAASDLLHVGAGAFGDLVDGA
jgi:hypothetical protein